jgi:hypothetical protein
MGRLCRFFIILIAAYTAAGCFSPIGSIGGSEADLLLAKPKQLQYRTGDTYNPNYDLDVFASYEGVEELVPLDLVKIRITEPPYLPNDLREIPFDSGYVLKKIGSSVIILEYDGLSTSYSIEVLDSSGNITGSGGSPGIHIEWAK